VHGELLEGTDQPDDCAFWGAGKARRVAAQQRADQVVVFGPHRDTGQVHPCGGDLVAPLVLVAASGLPVRLAVGTFVEHHAGGQVVDAPPQCAPEGSVVGRVR
jgi:hypothetical protein